MWFNSEDSTCFLRLNKTDNEKSDKKTTIIYANIMQFYFKMYKI